MGKWIQIKKSYKEIADVTCFKLLLENQDELYGNFLSVA